MEIIHVFLSDDVTARIFIHLRAVGSKEEINELKDDVCISLEIKSFNVCFLQRENSNSAFILTHEDLGKINVAITTFEIPKYTVTEWDG